MLLHLYVQKIHFESPPPSGIACFLSIHSGAFEYCISSVYYKNNTAYFDQVVHVPIQKEQDSVIKVNLISSIFLKNGSFEPQGKCSFIASPIEHGRQKRLSLFSKSGAILSEIELTTSFYDAPMNDGVWTGNPENTITDDFRREYEFLVTRKKNWGADRPASWKLGHENLLVQHDASEKARKEPSPAKKHTPSGSSATKEPPKLRKTCRAVGYLSFWPNQDTAVGEEEKILLKLKLAEQRRLKLLQDAEEKVRARNKMDKRISEAALHKQPENDLLKLKKILSEKERELQLLRSRLSMEATKKEGAKGGVDFYSYHRAHSAVTSKIQSVNMGPKVPPKASTDSAMVKKKAISKKASTKKMTKPKKLTKSKKNESPQTAKVKQKKPSRIGLKREKLKLSSPAGKGSHTRDNKSPGETKLIKKILSKSQTLQQRLNNSLKSAGKDDSDDIKIKLHNLRQSWNESSEGTAEAMSHSSDEIEDYLDPNKSLAELRQSFREVLGTGHQDDSIGELRQSFREVLDLTAKKQYNKIVLTEKPFGTFTRTLFIPTSTSLKMNVMDSDAKLSDSNEPSEAFLLASPICDNKTHVPKSIGVVHTAPYSNSKSPDVVMVADGDMNSSVYNDLVSAMKHSVSSESEDEMPGTNETYQMKGMNPTLKEASVASRQSSNTMVKKRVSVMAAETASSSLKKKNITKDKVVVGSIKKSASIPEMPSTSKVAARATTKKSPMVLSSYFQLLSSASKDMSDDSEFNRLLFGVAADESGIDEMESTMAKLLATTPLSTGKLYNPSTSPGEMAYAAAALTMGQNENYEVVSLDSVSLASDEVGREEDDLINDDDQVDRFVEINPAEKTHDDLQMLDCHGRSEYDVANDKAIKPTTSEYSSVDYNSQIDSVEKVVLSLEEKIMKYMQGSQESISKLSRSAENGK